MNSRKYPNLCNQHKEISVHCCESDCRSIKEGLVWSGAFAFILKDLGGYPDSGQQCPQCPLSHSITVTESWELEGTSVGHLAQPPCQSTVTYSRLHRTSSRWVLSISREGDSTSPLGSLVQGSTTLRGKKFFLVFSWNCPCFHLCLLPLSCHWAPLHRVWKDCTDTGSL